MRLPGVIEKPRGKNCSHNRAMRGGKRCALPTRNVRPETRKYWTAERGLQVNPPKGTSLT